MTSNPTNPNSEVWDKARKLIAMRGLNVEVTDVSVGDGDLLLQDIMQLFASEHQRLLDASEIPEKYNGTIYGSEYEAGRNDAIDEFTALTALREEKL